MEEVVGAIPTRATTYGGINMDFMIGLSGVLVGLAILAIGLTLGWKASEVYSKKPVASDSIEELTEDEKKRVDEQQEALNFLQSYNINDVYGSRMEADGS